MDRIEKLERAGRWQRLCIILLGVICLLGAKIKASVFEAVEAKTITCDNVSCADFNWIDPTTLRAHCEVRADREVTQINATSPNGRNYIDIRASDEEAYVMIKIGEKSLVIDEEMIDTLNRLVEQNPLADDSAASANEPVKSPGNPAHSPDEK